MPSHRCLGLQDFLTVFRRYTATGDALETAAAAPAPFVGKSHGRRPCSDRQQDDPGGPVSPIVLHYIGWRQN